MASFDAVHSKSAVVTEKPAAAAAAAAGDETTSSSSTSRREYIAAELEEVRAMFPAPMIQAANSSFVQVVVM